MRARSVFAFVSYFVAIQCPWAGAYITSGLPPSKHRQWLEQMTTEICSSPTGSLTPEMIEAAPEVMSAWAKNPYADSSSPGSNKDPTTALSSLSDVKGRDCALAVERLMKRLVDEQTATGNDDAATTYAYNAVIHGWSRSGEGEYAAQRAEQILIEMQDRFETGNKNVQPNTASFRSVLMAWQHANDAQRAQRILDWMIALHEAGSNDSAEANTECFHIVMKAWAVSNVPDAPRKIEELLVTMDRLYQGGNNYIQPNLRTYNLVLEAWSKSKLPGAAKRAEEILDHMNKLSQQGEPYNQIKADFQSYNCVSLAWAKSGATCSARKADSTLKRLEKAYKESSDPNLQPDSIMFNVCIDSWSQTSARGKTNGLFPFESARRLLDRQIALFEQGANKCRPDVYGYTSVIKACEATAGKPKRLREKAFKVAQSTFHELCSSEYAVPNHVAYGTMLKACRLLPRDSLKRDELVRSIFEKACRDGCVGSMTLNRFKAVASSALCKQLLGGVKRNDLPYEWTFRVPKDDKKLHRHKQSSKRKLPRSFVNTKQQLRP